MVAASTRPPARRRTALRVLTVTLLIAGATCGWALEYADLIGRYEHDSEMTMRRREQAGEGTPLPLERLQRDHLRMPVAFVVLHRDHIEFLGAVRWVGDVVSAASVDDIVLLRIRESRWQRSATTGDATEGPAIALRLTRIGDRVLMSEDGPDPDNGMVLRQLSTPVQPDAEVAALGYYGHFAAVPGLGWFGGSWWPLAILALQGLCFLHLLRTRGDLRWLFAIIFMPVVGSLVYLLWHRALPMRLPTGRLLALPMLERFDLGRVEKAFRHSDTLANRIAYAEALLARGRHDEALALYPPALAGPQRGDVTLLFSHAKACYAAGRLREAADTLLRAEQVPNNEKLRQRHLLLALCLHHLGDDAAAEERFRAAIAGFNGEEARCRYGLFLEALGRRDEARRQFEKVLDSAAHSVWTYRRAEAFWIRTAKARVQALATPAP